MDDRPAPSPEKLLGQFRDWMADDELPGRTMSYLKTGFLPEVLEGIAERNDVPAMLDAWQTWEAGTTTPSAVLEALRSLDLESLLVELAGE